MASPLPRTTGAPGQQKELTYSYKLLEGNSTRNIFRGDVLDEGYGSRETANIAEFHKQLSTAYNEAAFLRKELHTHARYIRDKLSPILLCEPNLTHSDSATLRSIFKLLHHTSITLDVLRSSRMEKALQLIVATGPSVWPMEAIVHAENLLQKWEDQLGQGSLKNLRADLWGPGGRLQGVRRIEDTRHRDDDAKSSWEVEGAEASKAYECGDLGFEVGHWWLKEAAAFRDGIIDETSHAITADENGAYAIVLSGNCEQNLRSSDDQFEYHALKDEPNGFMMSKTMTRNDPEDKVVRVLRSWRLRSKLAPKAGLRYDGLYRIIGYGFKRNTWQIHVTLSRIPEQQPILSTLHSDMLDDWKDYRHFKNTDRGDDFAILRDILRDAIQEKDKKDGKTARHESYDSGYFSRRESDLGEQPAIRTPESASEVKFVLVAEGTPAAESETSTLHLGLDGALDGKDILNGVAFSAQNAFEITDSSGASQEIEPIAPEDTWSTCASECSTRVVKTAYRFLE